MALCKVNVPQSKKSTTRTEPMDILANRTLADVQSIIQAGDAKKYFIVGDYFDLTMDSAVTLDNGSIAKDSTWRA